jgi:NAD(P)-dependent dehydrogenase (short-subunit alcohol dehydrogenase family)
MLFINAGTTNNEKETSGEVTTEEFLRVMVTNALCPMRVGESLEDLVSANGLIGVMSSSQGSVANNVTGMREVYRASKAALNQFMAELCSPQLCDFPRDGVDGCRVYPDRVFEESVPNLVKRPAQEARECQLRRNTFRCRQRIYQGIERGSTEKYRSIDPFCRLRHNTGASRGWPVLRGRFERELIHRRVM